MKKVKDSHSHIFQKVVVLVTLKTTSKPSQKSRETKPTIMAIIKKGAMGR
ncbi:MAG: hypothetical protein H7Y04_10245 [Verrucomicrobia bacterium]|nr:hypothetical protein [Cytophagales bacterium]